jgi:hypothetical protein
MLRQARIAAATALAVAAAAVPAQAQGAAVHVRTLGSFAFGPPAGSELAGAIFYGRISSPEPVVAWFEYRIGDSPAVHATGHRSFGSARGGRKIRGTGHGMPVLTSSYYRVVAEVKGSDRPIHGGWKSQPNFGPNGVPSPSPLPPLKDPN